MRKLFAKWVPKCLKADQKRQRCQSSEQLLEFFRRDPNDFLSGAIGDHGRNLTRRQSNNQWSGGLAAHPRSKKFRVQKSAGKFLASIFWDQDCILLTDYLPKGQTLNSEYYSSLLVQLKDILKEKRRGKVTRGSCTWASTVLITHHILRIWPHRTTTWSLDWKKQLKVRHFSSDAKVIAAAETWLDWQRSEFFLSCLRKLEQQAKECIELRGEYFE